MCHTVESRANEREGYTIQFFLGRVAQEYDSFLVHPTSYHVHIRTQNISGESKRRSSKIDSVFYGNPSPGSLSTPIKYSFRNSRIFFWFQSEIYLCWKKY